MTRARAALGCGLGLMLCALGPFGGTRVGAADGLDVASTTTYTIDPTAGVVRVVVELNLHNSTTDRREGNVVRRTYFDAFTLPVPAGAVDLTATSNGAALAASSSPSPETTDFSLLEIQFATRLFSGQSASILVAYDLTGLPPRSDNPWRVNPAYVSFSAFGVGDPGMVTVRIVVPEGFVVDTFGDSSIVTTTEGTTTIYTATDIAAPDEFEIYVSASNHAALTRRSFDVGGGADPAAFEVRAWPDDAEWEQFVVVRLTEGVPVLAGLIGQPWPIDGTLTVRETVTPYLYGYAGWFDPLSSEIEIGEDLDIAVVLHELSHAWFNRSWFIERWISEGMAQTFAAAAAESLGAPADQPDAVRSDTPGAGPLNDWTAPAGDDVAAIEEYGYNTSWFVIDSLVDDMGVASTQALFAAIEDRTIAYRGEGEPDQTSASSADWRRVLDLVEEIGGVDDAEQLFADYVVAPDDRQLLDDRAAARARYDEIRTSGGAWAPPLVVRREMDSWDFAAAEPLLTDALQILEQRDTLAALSQPLGVTVPSGFEEDYQSAEITLDPVAAALDEQLTGTRAVAEAIAAEAEGDGFFGGIGLLGTDLHDRLDEARDALTGDPERASAIANEVTDTLDEATDIGRQRFWAAVAITLGFLMSTALGIVWLSGRHRRRHRRQQVTVPPEAPVADDDTDTDTDGGPDPDADAVVVGPRPDAGNG